MDVQGSRRAARVWLDVPFEEKDAVKALGARWDRDARSWYAPAAVPLEPLARWLVDLSIVPGPRRAVQLVGLALQCWRCHETTVCVVGFVQPPGRISLSIVTADDDFSLSIAARLLGEHRQQHRVGRVRRRFSRTVDGYQVANGCYHCDALQGNFFLFQEELPEGLADEGLDALLDLGTYEVPEYLWQVIDQPRNST